MTKPLRYKKRPIEVEAYEWTEYVAWGDLLKFTNNLVRLNSLGEVFHVYDRLHDTWVRFEYGDYIIKGVQGEFYPCKPDVFKETYQIVEREE